MFSDFLTCITPFGVTPKSVDNECLSEELTKLAQQRGHAEASHIAWIGKRGWKDWELKAVIVDGDWTFVTRNSVDFRGPLGVMGTKQQTTRSALVLLLQLRLLADRLVKANAA